ncbi:hypothetical protein NP493_639g00026 [Ridgeia piscesae]|uniref:G-protein coupled receptors family 1 profile domain-containing protein n=1 Tax=Ridgeia piscesae TaxID=27915 RepID=A0AAD9NQA9_RIDPI|nr:hypothetical protein NP493_639g00026 [Ridgeia piscesae]
MMLIACDRFFGVVFSMKAYLTDRRAASSIILVWLCSAAISSPILSIDPRTQKLVVAQTSRTFYYTFISVVLFFCPLVVMGSAYLMIIRRLWSNHQLGETVIVMLVMLLVVFAVCWLPFQIAILYAEHHDNKGQLPRWFDKFYFFANYIAFANSAFNPIIYTGFNTNFRRGFKAIFMTRKEAKRYYNSLSTQKGAAHNSWSSSSNIQVTKI